MKSKKKRIEEYLLSIGCNPALKGFKILSALISYSMEDPGYNKAQLFSRFMEEHPGVSSENAAYRSVRYCIDSSLSAEKRVYPMIKTSAIFLKGGEK